MTSRPEPGAAIVAMYSALLRLYPRAARERAGADQLRLFIEIVRDERPASFARRIVWMSALFARAAGAGLAYHWDGLRAARAGLDASPRRSLVGRSLTSDLRQAVRLIRRRPSHATAVAAVVALGVSLTATVFALVDGVLFKPLPYRAPHELFTVRGLIHGVDPLDVGRAASSRELREWQAAVPEADFTGTGTAVGYGTLGVINGPTVWSRSVDARFWDVLGVQPLIGGFEAADYDADLPIRPAIISYGLWQRLYGGAPDIVGRRLETLRSTFRIAGVLPRDFVFPTAERQAIPDVLHPLVVSGDPSASHSRYLTVIARVPAGVSHASVIPRLERAAQSVIGPDERAKPFDVVTLTPLKQTIVGEERTSAAAAFAAVALMVLLVAVNVGGLVASRSQDRAREAAVRRALGATWLDLARLHLVEVGCLAAAGAVAGTVAARWLLVETATRLPPDILLLRAPEIDARVIVAVAVAAALVALVATMFGVRATYRASITAILGQGAGAAMSEPRRLSRFVLQAGQVALAIALVVGGALFVTSLHRAWTTDAGYHLADTIYLDVRLGPGPGSGAGNNPTRVLELLRSIQQVPGVERATVIDTILLGRVRRGSPLQPVGGPADSAIGELIPISSGYFDIAGLQAIEGRLPSDAEIDDAQLVAVVSERTAREYWPGRSAVGQILSSKRGALTVIGVVRDARFRALDLESQGEIYAPLALGLWSSTAANFLIRSPLPEERVLPGVIEAVRRYDRASTIRRAQLVSAALAESIRRRRFHAWLFGVLAASGLLIAGAGIFGVVAGATARRTREMGVRLALGSTRDRLIRLLVREQLTPVVAGVLAGGIAAAWAARYVTSMLYGVSAYDGRVWAAAAAIVIGVALAGALLPALRASRVDPVVALRAE